MREPNMASPFTITGILPSQTPRPVSGACHFGQQLSSPHFHPRCLPILPSSLPFLNDSDTDNGFTGEMNYFSIQFQKQWDPL